MQRTAIMLTYPVVFHNAIEINVFILGRAHSFLGAMMPCQDITLCDGDTVVSGVLGKGPFYWFRDAIISFVFVYKNNRPFYAVVDVGARKLLGGFTTYVVNENRWPARIAELASSSKPLGAGWQTVTGILLTPFFLARALLR